MRTAACLDAHNALRRQRLSTREDELVFLCIDVVGNDVDLVVLPEALTERFDQRGFPRANRSADPDPQWTVTSCLWTGLERCASGDSHERNSLVYCVSCSMDARSTMNAADPRSSI